MHLQIEHAKQRENSKRFRMLEHRVGRTAGIEMGDGKRKPCVGLYVKSRTMVEPGVCPSS